MTQIQQKVKEKHQRSEINCMLMTTWTHFHQLQALQIDLF